MCHRNTLLSLGGSPRRNVDSYTAMPYEQLMYYEFIELGPVAAVRDDLQIILVAAYGKNEREDVPRQWLRKLKEHFDEQDA